MRGEFVDVGGLRLYYYAAGSKKRSAGVPVVLIHGFPTSSRLWHAVARDFPDGHRLVVLDLPGYGRSDAPGNGRPPAANQRGASVRRPTCASHANAVLGAMDQLGIARACVVGHGLGGGVAQAIAVDAPQRVSHLALVSSVAFDHTPRRMARLARLAAPLARASPAGLLAGLVSASVVHGFARPERSRLALDACLHTFTTPSGRDVLARHLRALAPADTADWSARLGELRIPAAVVWGSQDPFFPTSLGARLAAAIPGATFEVINGARHYVPEDAAPELLAVLTRLLGAAPAE